MYRYLIYTDEGKIIEGEIDSISEKIAEDALYKAGFNNIISLRRIKPHFDFKKLLAKYSRVSDNELADFTIEVATLIRAGLNIITILNLLYKQISNKVLKSVIQAISNDLKNGKQFHEALSAFPEIFSPTYIGVVRAGEKSGTLDTGLHQIADEMKRQIATKSKVKHALIEPAIIIAVAIGVAIILVTMVLPPLLDIFTSFNANLPATARVLVAVTNFFNAYGLRLLLGIIILAAAGMLAYRNQDIRRSVNRYLLGVPMLGSTILWHFTSRICSILGELIKAGITIPETMNIVTQTTSNKYLQDVLRTIRSEIVEGRSVSQAFRNSKVFPNTLIEMISIGENSGQLDQTFISMAEYYSNKVENRLVKFTTLLEPLLILCLGLVVGFLALSIIGTLYSLPGSIGI